MFLGIHVYCVGILSENNILLICGRIISYFFAAIIRIIKGQPRKNQRENDYIKKRIRGYICGSNIDIYYKVHPMATKARNSSTYSWPSPKNKYTNKKANY
jgi:hypothetical protein